VPKSGSRHTGQPKAMANGAALHQLEIITPWIRMSYYRHHPNVYQNHWTICF
jgi:hypothetical protein